MVEWKKLGDFAMLQKTKNRKHVTENAYSITQEGLVPTKSFFKEKTNITSNDTSGYYIVEKDWFVYSPSRIDVGSISFLKDDGPVIVSPIDVVFSIDKKVCLPSYLLNYFFTYQGRKDLLKNREGVEGTGRRSLPFSAIENMLIPVPLLQEQEQIVKTFDTFTSSIENLKEQIVQRRKQYEYYRDQLLDLEGKPGVEMKTLGELSYKISSGRNKNKEDHGQYPVFGSTGIIAYTNSYLFDKPLILVARVGANAGYVYMINEKCDVTDNTLIVETKEDNNRKFIYYYLVYMNINQFAKGGGQPLITGGLLKDLLIPLPPLSEQQRIVTILDTFEASIHNLEQQLAQREKQYEYYRNILLSFE